MKIFLLIFLLIGGDSLSKRSFRDFKIYPSKEINPYVTPCYIPKFTKENLQQYILTKRIIHPEIVFAQAVLETGNFSSRIFRENHNLFGMRLAKKRRTLAIGERYNHAVYNNWMESVDDYLLWQQQFKKTPLELEKHYYRLLDRIYAEDPNYVKVVKIVRRRNDWI